MDYNALRKFRGALEELNQIAESGKTINSNVVQIAQDATKELAPEHVTRELRMLPSGAARIVVMAKLASAPDLSNLRMMILTDKDLMRQPKKLTNRVKKAWGKLFAQLVISWKQANQDAGLSSQSLQLLEKQYMPFIVEIERNTAATAQHSESPQGELRDTETVSESNSIKDPSQNVRLTRLVPQIREDVNGCQKNVVDALKEIDQGLSLLGNIGIAELRDGGHDGVQELVNAAWSQISKAYRNLRTLKLEANGLMTTATDAVLMLHSKELLDEIDSYIKSLRNEEEKLNEMGFDLCALDGKSNNNMANINQSFGSDDSEDDEDEWEDAVDVKPEVQNEATEEKEEELEQVENWAAVMRGKDGKKMNEALLDKLEKKAAETGAASSSTAGAQFIERVEKRQKELAKERSKVKEKRGKANGTAKNRLKAALGMKKRRKKKSLLD